jgi:hypothetical protein
MLLALTFPIIDTDRMTPSSGGGGRVSARVWIAVGFGALFVVWLVFRLNDWFVR